MSGENAASRTTAARMPPRWKWWRLLLLAVLVGGLGPPAFGGRRFREQVASLEVVFYRGDGSLASGALALPDKAERRAYRHLRKASRAEALDLVDELYGRRLRPLAVRDSDGDGIADFRLSDYYGKFLEGDVDVDGDGVRNVLDAAPFDERIGGRDTDGDGVPEAGTFEDRNGNGLPDHLDWGLPEAAESPERAAMARIQLGLFRDFGIVLVERDARFDLPLAQAVDDAVRVVFGQALRAQGRLSTLRTVAVERNALLSERRASKVEDLTGAQVFSQSQTLTVYDEGRISPHPLLLLGLLVHEMAHAWQVALDYDAGNPAVENRRVSFPAPRFAALVEPFGWERVGWEDDSIAGQLPVQPLFAYVGVSQPLFTWRGRSPEEWAAWLEERWIASGESADYLSDPAMARLGLVSDYSLTSAYEWHSENLLAYVFLVLEEEAKAAGWLADEVASRRLAEAVSESWPGFDYHNIAADVLESFRRSFPMTPAARRLLAERYLLPVLRDDTGE